MFGHDGGVDGLTTRDGTWVPPGPSAFAHAQNQFTTGNTQLIPAVRRPTSLHLRGSLARAGQQAEPHEAAEWSATGEPSPVQNHEAQPSRALSDPTTPVEGVPAHEIMAEFGRQYDLNVQEAEHMEWLIGSGLRITYGMVSHACDTLRFPRRSQQATPQALDERAQTPPQTRAQPLPQSWNNEGSFQSPPPPACPSEEVQSFHVQPRP